MIIKKNIERNSLTVEFNDNGIGVMQQDIYKVMSVFGQAYSGYRNEGTGIGQSSWTNHFSPGSKKIGSTFDDDN